MVVNWFAKCAGVGAVVAAAVAAWPASGQVLEAQAIEPRAVVEEAQEGASELPPAPPPTPVSGALQIIGERDVAPAEPSAETQKLVVKANSSKFWLGVSCEPIGDALKAQLGVEYGLVVQNVVAASPAEAANLRMHDVLLKLDETKLMEVGQLIDTVEAAGAKPVTITLRRGGKEETFKVQIVERPQRSHPGEYQLNVNDIEARKVRAEEMRAFFEAHKLHDDEALEMMVVRPGVAVPGDRVRPFKLPDDVKISSQKKGDQPAKIDIERGDKKWSVTDDKLDELPGDIRALVEGFRGRTFAYIQATPPGKQVKNPQIFSLRLPQAEGTSGRLAIRMPEPLPPTPARVAYPPHAHSEKQLDAVLKKLDEVLDEVRGRRAIDQLEKEVDRLRRDVDSLQKERERR